MALTFDPRSVFQGMLLPTSITIERPTIEAEIDREGGMLRRIFSDSSSQSQGEAVAILVEQLLAEPNYQSLIGQLDTVKIEQAKLTLRDTKTGITWVAPAARAELKRDATGVIISAGARFSRGGDPIDVSLTGVYARDRSRFSVDANVDGLKPSMFADLSPDAVLLRGLDIALSGRLHVEADGRGDIRTVAIDVTGGNGRVTLPGVLPASHQVKSVNARATVDAATHMAKDRAHRRRFRRRQGVGHRHRAQDRAGPDVRRPRRGAADPGRSPGRLLAARLRRGRPAVGAGQSQQRRDRRRRRVRAERARATTWRRSRSIAWSA